MDIQELWPGGPLFRQSEHFKLSTDSVLLADFVQIRGAKRGIDLGCGSGILSLLLAQKSAGLRITGLELLPEAAAAARENAARNGMEGRIEVVNGDIRECRALFRAGSFDLAVSNPPYFPADRGAVAPRADRAAARAEASCSLSELCDAAAFLLRTGGSLFLVHRPERLPQRTRSGTQTPAPCVPPGGERPEPCAAGGAPRRKTGPADRAGARPQQP